MKRLTYKNYIEEYEVNFEKSSDKNWSIAESDTHIKVTGEPIKKLGELEDVLESWHIENLEELKTRLHDCQVYHLKNNSNETLIHNLKNELAELKQKAMISEFYIGQDVWCVYKYWWNGKLTSDPDKIAIEKFFIDEIHKDLNGYYYIFRRHSNDGINQPEFNSYGRFNTIGSRNIKEYYLFATQEEAEQKLTEIGGKDE